MNHSAPVKARSKSLFAMDDQTFLGTRSFDSTFASSHSDSSFQNTSDGNQTTLEMPNEDFFKLNVDLTSTLASSDRQWQPVDTPRYVDPSSMQYPSSNRAIGSQKQETGWIDESDRRTGSVGISESEHSSKQYTVNHHTMNSQSQDSERNVASDNTKTMIQDMPIRKPVVSAEARSRWAMLAALAGVSKTEESEVIEENTAVLNQTQQFATNADYQVDEEVIQEGREIKASKIQQSKATGMLGGLSDVANMERTSHAQQEAEDIPSGSSVQYTSSMEKYLQSLGNDPLIDSRGFTEGFQSFSRNEERQIQDSHRVVEENFGLQDGVQLEQSLVNSRGEESIETNFDDGTQNFRVEDNTVASNLGSEDYYAGGNVSRDAQQFKNEVGGGDRSVENDLRTSEFESVINSGKTDMETDILSSVQAVERGFKTGELALQREFRTAEQDLGMALRSGEHILKHELNEGAKIAKDELHGNSLVRGIESGEQVVRDGLQTVAREVEGPFDGRSFQGALRTSEHEVESVLQSGAHQVERVFDGKVLQEIRQDGNILKQDLQSVAQKIALSGHDLANDLKRSEQELTGVLQGGIHRVEAEGSDLLGDLRAGTGKLEGSHHASGLEQHLRQGEDKVKQALYTGIRGPESALGGQNTAGRPTQGPARSEPERLLGRAPHASAPANTSHGNRPPVYQQGPVVPAQAAQGVPAGLSGPTPPSSTLVGTGRGNTPLIHQQGMNIPSRPGGMAPNSHLAGSIPNRPTSNHHGPAVTAHPSVPNVHSSVPSSQGRVPTAHAPVSNPHQPVRTPLNTLGNGRKDQLQGGAASKRPQSAKPQATGSHGTPQQAQGAWHQLPGQTSGSIPTIQNQRPNQNLNNHQQPAPQTQQVAHQPRASLQQNRPGPGVNAPQASGVAQARPQIQQQLRPTNVNQANRQQTPQQPHQPMSTMQHNQPRPAANAGQPNAGPQLQRPQQPISTPQQNQQRPTTNTIQPGARPQAQQRQNQQSQPQHPDQRQQGNRHQMQQQPQQPIPTIQHNLPISSAGAGQPGAIPQAGRPQIQPSRSQDVNERQQALPPLPGAAAHSDSNQTAARANPAAGSSGTAPSQGEPVKCSHGEHEPRSCPHEKRAQSCQHQEHEANRCPHKANAQLCSHIPHDPQSCPHQRENLQGIQNICDHQGHGIASCPHQQKAQACNHNGHEAYSCPHQRNALKCSHRLHEAKECPHEATDSVRFNQGRTPPQANLQQNLDSQQPGVGRQNASLQQPPSAQQLETGKQGLDHQQVTNSQSPSRGQQQMQRQQPQTPQQQARPPKQANSQQLADSQQQRAARQHNSAQQHNRHEEQSQYEQHSSTHERTESTHLRSQQQETRVRQTSESHEESSDERTSYGSEQQAVPTNPFQTLLATFAAQHQASATPNPGFFERKFSLPFPASIILGQNPQPWLPQPFRKAITNSRHSCRGANRLPLNLSPCSNEQSPHQNRRRRDAGG